MKIVKVQPYAKLLGSQEEHAVKLKNIEQYARVSHRSEDKAGTNPGFLRSILHGHGDWSVVEHEKATCEFLVDRGITHEIVRHRIGSYTQESTRFVNYKKGGEISVIAPYTFLYTNNVDVEDAWWDAVTKSCNTYANLVNSGVAPQIARSVLPTCLASKIIVTYNLRTWRHFFVMRMSAEAHPQMKEVVQPLFSEFVKAFPDLYDDIVPGERQINMMRLPR